LKSHFWFKAAGVILGQSKLLQFQQVKITGISIIFSIPCPHYKSYFKTLSIIMNHTLIACF